VPTSLVAPFAKLATRILHELAIVGTTNEPSTQIESLIQALQLMPRILNGTNGKSGRRKALRMLDQLADTPIHQLCNKISSIPPPSIKITQQEPTRRIPQRRMIQLLKAGCASKAASLLASSLNNSGVAPICDSTRDLLQNLFPSSHNDMDTLPADIHVLPTKIWSQAYLLYLANLQRI